MLIREKITEKRSTFNCLESDHAEEGYLASYWTDLYESLLGAIGSL